MIHLISGTARQQIHREDSQNSADKLSAALLAAPVALML
jgi:hypothetical protein